MQVVSQPPSVRFGKLASDKDFQRIKQLAEREGLDSRRLDPDLTQVIKNSRVPIWNGLKNNIPGAYNMVKTIFKLALKNQATGEYPYAAFLMKYPTVKRADKAFKSSLNVTSKVNETPYQMERFRVSVREVLTVLIPQGVAKPADDKPSEPGYLPANEPNVLAPRPEVPGRPESQPKEEPPADRPSIL